MSEKTKALLNKAAETQALANKLKAQPKKPATPPPAPEAKPNEKQDAATKTEVTDKTKEVPVEGYDRRKDHLRAQAFEKMHKK